MTSTFCRCGADRRPNQRYCLACHAESMRKSRSKNELTELQRLKMNCRSYANVYKRRGKLIQEPCAKCGDPKSQMHHHDYTKPLEVEWLCRRCHLAEHSEE